MNWLDFILDNISEFGLYITKLEKKFLDNYYSKEINKELTERYDFYKSIYESDVSSSFLLENITFTNETDVTDLKLNILWDNIKEDDADNFQNIYNIPTRKLNLEWEDLDDRYRREFHLYWKKYYRF